MWTLVLAIHIILCLFIIIIILLQSGKGSDMGAAFGGSSQTVFGARGGATFLSKVTTTVAIGFLVTCLALAYLTTKKRESALIKQDLKIEQTKEKEAGEAKEVTAKEETKKVEEKKEPNKAEEKKEPQTK